MAAALEDHQVSDDQILSALAAQLAPPAQGSGAEGPNFKLVETAGGVLSPGTLPFVRMDTVGLIHRHRSIFESQPSGRLYTPPIY